MSSCKECLHCEICKYNDGVNAWCKGNCPHFKDKSKSVDLPCKVGDYIEWQNNRGNIVLLEIKGFEFDEQGNAQKYLTKYSDIQPFVDSKDVMSVIAKEEAEQAFEERSSK
jgi:hypothetical protein